MPTIQINFDYFLQLGNLPFPLMLARLFLDGGWIFVLFILSQGSWLLWLQSRRRKFGMSLSFTVLAIDIPRMNDQTPKAVEQIFSHLSGCFSGFDKFETYWLGKFNPTFSFELVSIDGYVQYVVHCQKKYRDLIESAVYAQYPDAEITEIPDYTDKIPTMYPHPEWEVFGTEYILKNASHLPLRTWIQFEHPGSEVPFKDPMSSILEVMSSLKQGEQLWLQFLLTPTDEGWIKKGEEAINKLTGKKTVHKTSFVESLFQDIADIPMAVLTEATGMGGAVDDKKKGEDDKLKMLALTPGERSVLEAIQMKLSKIGFLVKMRVIYAGKRNVFNKGRLTSLKGAFGQFSAMNMNAIKGYGPVTPKGDYFWQRWSEQTKKMSVLRNYRNRSGKGGPPFVLNIEELATIYHFPMKEVKAPLVKKTDAKRAEPPSSLPTEDRFPTAGIGKPRPIPLTPNIQNDEDEQL